MKNQIKIFIDFLKTTIQSRKMIAAMVSNDFKVKYASSALGIVWAFVQPTVQILVLIFVFTVAFPSSPTPAGVPHTLYLVCGIIAWNFFSEALANGSNSLIEYSYLVKKVVFRTSILPVVKTLSSLVVHCVFIVLAYIVAMCFGYFPTIYSLQILYYLPCLLLIIIGINWLTSALTAFFRDISQLITVFLQLFVWLTPIMWQTTRINDWIINIGSMHINLISVFKINPMFYIVDGYRDSITGSTWFWEKPVWTLYYLVAAFGLFVFGATIFHRLRPHFSDVL